MLAESASEVWQPAMLLCPEVNQLPKLAEAGMKCQLLTPESQTTCNTATTAQGFLARTVTLIVFVANRMT